MHFIYNWTKNVYILSLTPFVLQLPPFTSPHATIWKEKRWEMEAGVFWGGILRKQARAAKGQGLTDLYFYAHKYLYLCTGMTGGNSLRARAHLSHTPSTWGRHLSTLGNYPPLPSFTLFDTSASFGLCFSSYLLQKVFSSEACADFDYCSLPWFVWLSLTKFMPLALAPFLSSWRELPIPTWEETS